MRQGKRTPIFLAVLLIGVVAVTYHSYRIHRVPVAPPERLSEGYTLATGAIVREEELVDGGVDEGKIPPIDEPVFESVPSADAYLKDDGLGLALTRDGEERFYPFQLLVWHEVVNQSGKDPFVVTYSPLTGVAAAFEASTAPGTRMTFVSSGKLWNNGTVLKDRETGSLWIQAGGEAFNGSLKGTKLKLLPTEVTTWRTWEYEHPTGRVLSRETGETRDYTENPYGDYPTSLEIFFPLTHVDPRLPAKNVVYGVARGGEARAYPASAFTKNGEVIDAFAESSLSLTKQSDGVVLADDGTPLMRAYWFFWSVLYPNTSVYGM